MGRNVPRPILSLLSRDEVELIHQYSVEILEKIGVKIEDKETLNFLKKQGLEVNGRIVKIPSYVVKESLSKCPRKITLYDRDGKPYHVLGEGKTLFNPGSAAIKILDYNSMEPRTPTLKDLRDLVIVVDALEYIRAQSTALVPGNVPIEVRDLVRLYPILKYSKKPIITGAFGIEGLHYMVKALSIVMGDVTKKPIAIFDVCPSPPLHWSKISVRNLVDGARYKVPLEIIPMPQLGATGPVTIAGSLVQHNAEALSAIVIAQLSSPGAPIIYGGSPSTFEMRHGTSLITGVEALLLVSAYTDMAKFYQLPVHGYLALSDSKLIDYQAGAETMIGALIAVIRGVDVASGPGMLEYESVQSLEKLVLDNDICGIALRYVNGFEINEETIAIDVISKVGPGGNFLTQRHTVKYLRRELFMPKVLDRTSRGKILKKALERAHERVKQILEKHEPPMLAKDVESELYNYMNSITTKYGYKLEKV